MTTDIAQYQASPFQRAVNQTLESQDHVALRLSINKKLIYRLVQWAFHFLRYRHMQAHD